MDLTVLIGVTKKEKCMKTNRIIIAGSRTAPENNQELFLKVTAILNQLGFEDVEIVSGGAKGADKFGENFAKEMLLPIKQFKPDWDKFGKSAGMIRNKQMAEYATHLILIWDGKSKGSANMLKRAQEKELEIFEIII